jgi:hypothetical protein
MVDISDAFVVGVWFFDQNCFGYVGEDIIFGVLECGCGCGCFSKCFSLRKVCQ